MGDLRDERAEYDSDDQTEARLEAYAHFAADFGSTRVLSESDIDGFVAGQREALNQIEELLTLLVTDNWNIDLE